MAKLAEVEEALDTLDAERLIEVVKLRNALAKEFAKLLPEAIAQAKPSGRGKKWKPGSPALLRLITRFAMRPALSPKKERR